MDVSSTALRNKLEPREFVNFRSIRLGGTMEITKPLSTRRCILLIESNTWRRQEALTGSLLETSAAWSTRVTRFLVFVAAQSCSVHHTSYYYQTSNGNSTGNQDHLGLTMSARWVCTIRSWNRLWATQVFNSDCEDFNVLLRHLHHTWWGDNHFFGDQKSVFGWIGITCISSNCHCICRWVSAAVFLNTVTRSAICANLSSDFPSA